MAKPQLENGYTTIANEILERLALVHLSANQWQVIICIIRKTYGFHKKVDYIANSQLCEATGLCKAVVSRAMRTLELMNIITRRGKMIGIQKDWERWRHFADSSQKLAEPLTSQDKKSKQNSQLKLAKQSTELAKSSTKVSSCAVTQNIKDTITKDTIQKKGFILPEWIDKETWSAFLEMRSMRRATPTLRAKQMLVKELEKLRAEGHEPNAVLDQSTMRCYTGVFPLKGGQNGKNKGYPISRRIPRVYKTPEEHFRSKDA